MTAKNLRKRTEPKTATPRVTAKTAAGGEVSAGLAGGDGIAGQLQADEGHHRSHGGGGQDDVDPLSAEFPYDEGQQAAQQAHHHEAALGVLKALGRDNAAGGR